MPRTPQQNAIIRDKRRTKILLKTLKLFATKGFDEVTIDAISIESACSHGLVYHYFEKKEDIFNGLFELQREDYNETISAIIMRSSTEQIRFAFISLKRTHHATI